MKEAALSVFIANSNLAKMIAAVAFSSILSYVVALGGSVKHSHLFQTKNSMDTAEKQNKTVIQIDKCHTLERPLYKCVCVYIYIYYMYK